ncbi:hypothetical protein ANACOL_02350 [Anaerotruncus colihominis DSM 17241]|uniref:Uncharacterized protein n=1 Tax=Anaerotruncus colihominis DSM 17241 TaxID=445972 RepID=B0PC41_9FIRM|nr:hypothetical protein ANACOL_02350 [Anaerotruncus colihominis DSM 17241]
MLLRGRASLCGVHIANARVFWDNNRIAVIIRFMAGAIRGRGPLPPQWPMQPRPRSGMAP